MTLVWVKVDMEENHSCVRSEVFAWQLWFSFTLTFTHINIVPPWYYNKRANKWCGKNAKIVWNTVQKWYESNGVKILQKRYKSDAEVDRRSVETCGNCAEMVRKQCKNSTKTVWKWCNVTY